MTEKNIGIVLDIFEDMFEQSLHGKQLKTETAIKRQFRLVKIQLLKKLWNGKIILERQDDHV